MKTEFNQFSAAAVEQAVNRLLSLDPEAQAGLNQFAGKVIQIQIDDLGLDYFLSFPNGCLVVQPSSGQPVSALISGRLSAFITTVLNQHSSGGSVGDSIFTGDLHFTGEIKTAQRFQEFVQNLEIDWQDPISRVFGDVAGHHLAKSFVSFGSFVSQIFNNAKQDIPDYLQHELKVSPTKFEINRYLEEVDQTRSQTDRLEARVSRLVNQLKERQSQRELRQERSAND